MTKTHILMCISVQKALSQFAHVKQNILPNAFKLYWYICVGNSTYHSGHPVGSTALAAASAPAGSWGSEMGERHRGVCSEAPGTRPVWAD